MSRLLGRRAVVYVDDLKIDALDVAFKVEKTLKRHPNVLDLTIYGLAATTMAKVQKSNVNVLLVAGYEDHVAQIFKGFARSILPQKQSPGWALRIQSGDGEAAYKYGNVSQSFAPGSSISDVVAGIAKQAKVGLGNAIQQLRKGNIKNGFDQFASGFSATGKATDELHTAISAAGFTWSIQDDELQLLQGDTDTIAGTAEVISGDTGMVGSPEMGSPERPNGPHLLKVACLLRPQLRCGSIVQVEATGVRGQFRCEKVTHAGDKAAKDWYTTVEAKQL